jgi:hypothetical protein
MKYVLLALNVLKQHKGSLSPASLKILEGIIEAIKEKLDLGIQPTDDEKEQLKALLPQLQYPELKTELLKLIER